jgi:hypothetical protein
MKHQTLTADRQFGPDDWWKGYLRRLGRKPQILDMLIDMKYGVSLRANNVPPEKVVQMLLPGLMAKAKNSTAKSSPVQERWREFWEWVVTNYHREASPEQMQQVTQALVEIAPLDIPWPVIEAVKTYGGWNEPLRQALCEVWEKELRRNPARVTDGWELWKKLVIIDDGTGVLLPYMLKALENGNGWVILAISSWSPRGREVPESLWMAWVNRLGNKHIKEHYATWTALVQLDREGKRLWPLLSKQVKTENNTSILEALGKWQPGKELSPETIETVWQIWEEKAVPEDSLDKCFYHWDKKIEAWKALINLGPRDELRLTRFLGRAVIREEDGYVLKVMSQWVPRTARQRAYLLRQWWKTWEKQGQKAIGIEKEAVWEAIIGLAAEGCSVDMMAKITEAVQQAVQHEQNWQVMEILGKWRPAPTAQAWQNWWELWMNRLECLLQSPPAPMKQSWTDEREKEVLIRVILRTLITLEKEARGHGWLAEGIHQGVWFKNIISRNPHEALLVVDILGEWSPDEVTGTECRMAWEEVWAKWAAWAVETKERQYVKDIFLDVLSRQQKHSPERCVTGTKWMLGELERETCPVRFRKLLQHIVVTPESPWAMEWWEILKKRSEDKHPVIALLSVLACQEWLVEQIHVWHRNHPEADWGVLLQKVRSVVGQWGLLHHQGETGIKWDMNECLWDILLEDVPPGKCIMGQEVRRAMKQKWLKSEAQGAGIWFHPETMSGGWELQEQSQRVLFSGQNEPSQTIPSPAGNEMPGMKFGVKHRILPESA